MAAKRPCTHPGCGALTESGRCDKHRKQNAREVDQRRGSSTQRGYGARWQKMSKGYLRSHPLCMCPDCQGGEIRITAAVVVDHIVPHRGDMKLFWDSTNWQSMAKTCHDRKTATEDGGFGREVRPGVKRETRPRG